jgi:uncharacterized membrane protein YozB (DUF420 family)
VPDRRREQADRMSTDELSPPTIRPATRPSRDRAPLWRRPWVVPLAVLTVSFVAFALPPYLTLDPAQARLQPMPAFRGYYPLLVTHIFLGSVVLLTACLQVWPWLRQTHPRVHRTSGRIYVAAALPASVCVMVIAPMGLHGANQQVANTMLAVLWFGTTLAGFRAVRQRRYADHRRWMLRSVALSFSIVTNRLWLVILFAVFVPEIYLGAPVDPVVVDQAIGVSTWIAGWSTC